MPTTSVNDSGTWRDATAIYYNDAGTWRTLTEVWFNDSGTWRQVFGSGGGGGGGGSISLTDQSISQVGSLGGEIAGYRLDSTGVVQARNRSSYSTRETWLVSGAASAYEARFTVTRDDGGLGANGSATGSWLNLATSREWYMADSVDADGITETMTATVEIRLASSGVVQATCTVTLNSQET